jgi:hypothetical protein
MATQVKGWPSGGAFTTITKDASGRAGKGTTFGVALAAGNQGNALRALNRWANCAGAATHGAAAQKEAKANGIQIQEV